MTQPSSDPPSDPPLESPERWPEQVPSVTAVRAYLDRTGWVRQPETWKDASVWLHHGGEEVLVPDRDTSVDTPLRLRETLDMLERLEQRHRDEIVRDIDEPDADAQTYWTFPGGDSLDLETLNGRYLVLNGIRKALRAAAESAVDAEAATSGADGGRARGRRVRSLLDRVQLRSGNRDRRIVIRVPVGGSTANFDDGVPLADALLPRMYEAMNALQDTFAGNVTSTVDMIRAGVTADLCDALGDLTGRRRDRPLRVDFRWGRSRPSAGRTHTVEFESDRGAELREIATRLRTTSRTAAEVTGRVASLHGRSTPYWELRMDREVVHTGATPPRTRGLRVLLADEEMYDAAMTAHRDDRRIRVRGHLEARGKRTAVLTVETGGFEVIG